MPKKKDSPGKLMDERFDTLENKIDNLDKKTEERFDLVDKKLNTLEDGQKLLLKMHFEQGENMKAMEERLDNKLDKILSFVSNLVITTEGIKQEVTVMGERVRRHEDKLEAIS